MKLLFPNIKLFCTLIFLTFSLITGTVYSQNQWQKLFGPFKGQVNDFVVSPLDPDIIIIVSDYGTYRTSDGGLNWSKVSQTPNSKIAVSTLNPDVMISSRERSFDGGISWGSITLVTSNDLEFSPGLNSVVYSIDFENKIKRTTDLGISWEVIDDSAGYFGTYRKILTDPSQPEYVWVLSDGGILSKSIDRGFSWQRIRFSLGHHVSVSACIDPVDINKIYIAASDTIFRSTDGGSTFSHIINPLSSTPWDIIVDSSNPSILYMISSYTSNHLSFMRSTNSGENWSPNFANKLSCNKLIGNSGKVFLSSFYSGIFVSNDDGINFKSIGYNTVQSKGIKVISDNIAYTWDEAGYYKTIDSGGSWTLIHGTGGFFANSLAVSPVDQNKIFVCDFNTIAISSNSGQTWFNKPTSQIGTMNEILLKPDNDFVIYVKGYSSEFGRYQLGKTTNEGSTWSLLTLPVETQFWSMRTNPQSPSDLYWYPITDNNNVIYKSTSGGNQWTMISPILSVGDFIKDMKVSRSGNLFLGARSLYESTNNGSSWFMIYQYYPPEMQIFYIDLHPELDSVMYNFHPYVNKLYGSIDQGESWEDAFQGLPTYTNHYYTGVSPGAMVYISTEKGMFRGNPLNIVHVGINPVSNVIEDYRLYQNYPNPFNPETKIKFSIPVLQNVRLRIYNSLGKEIAVLINEKFSPAVYEFTWNAASFPSGVYFYRLETENFIDTKKLILLK